MVTALGRRAFLAILVVVAAGLGTGWLFRAVPSGFIPYEDNGYFFVDISLPDAASLGRTEATLAEVEAILLADPDVEHVLSVAGFSLLAGLRSSGGLANGILKHWDERPGKAHTRVCLAACW